MSAALLIYGSEEHTLLYLIEARDEIEDEVSLEWKVADEALTEYLTSLPVHERVDRMCQTLASLKATLDGAEAEIMRLHGRQAAAKAQIATIELRAMNFMAFTGLKRIDGTHSSLTQVPNPWRVGFTNEALVPDEYREIAVTFNLKQWQAVRRLIENDLTLSYVAKELREGPTQIRKSLIRKVLDAGNGVPGAFLEQDIHLVRK